MYYINILIYTYVKLLFGLSAKCSFMLTEFQFLEIIFWSISLYINFYCKFHECNYITSVSVLRLLPECFPKNACKFILNGWRLYMQFFDYGKRFLHLCVSNINRILEASLLLHSTIFSHKDQWNVMFRKLLYSPDRVRSFHMTNFNCVVTGLQESWQFSLGHTQIMQENQN